MKTTLESGYRRFDELIAQLRAEGHTKLADKLHYMMYRVAWTTGSELIGEFGSEILCFRRQTDAISPELQRCIDSSMSFVREIWPDIK